MGDYEHVLEILTDIRDALNPTCQVRTEKALKFHDKPPVSTMQIQKLENLNEDGLDQLTEEAIAARLRKKWTALDHRQKRDRLSEFSRQYGDDATDAEAFILTEYFETKKIRPRDVEYDESNGVVGAIPCVTCGAEGFFISRRPKQAAPSDTIPASNSSHEPAGKKLRKPKPNKTFAAITKQLNRKR